MSCTVPSPAQHKIVAAQDVGESVYNLLNNGGWTRLTCETLARTFDPVIETFIGVTKDEERKQFVINDPNELDDQGESDLGLFLREKGMVKPNPRPDEIAEGRDKYDDTKFVYHYRPRVLGHYSRIPGLVERHVPFFAHTARMHGEAQILVHEHARELDRQMPGYGFFERTLEGEYQTVTRLLRYMCDGPSAKMANGHRDRDWLTIQERSDRLGLWAADNKDVIIPSCEETRTDSVFVFFGRKMWEMTQGRIRGIIHGVNDWMFEDAERSPRHTAVTFGHVKLTSKETEWGLQHVKELAFPDHIKNYGLK